MTIKHDNTAKNIDYNDFLGNSVLTGHGNFPTHKDFMQMPVILQTPISLSNSIVVSGVDVKLISSTNITGRIALGLDSKIKNGGIVAAELSGSLGTADATAVITNAIGNVWNLSRVVDATTLTPIFNGANKQVWALTQAKGVTDGDYVADSGSENLQVSFVVRSGSGFVAQAISDTVKIQFQKLHCWNSLPAEGILFNIYGEGDMRFDPPPVGGVEAPKYQTIISLTATQTNGIYSISASGTGYVTSGDIGDLGVDATVFNTSVEKRVFLNGTLLLKGTDVIWQTATTFQYMGTVDSDDIFTVIT